MNINLCSSLINYNIVLPLLVANKYLINYLNVYTENSSLVELLTAQMDAICDEGLQIDIFLCIVWDLKPKILRITDLNFTSTKKTKFSHYF